MPPNETTVLLTNYREKRILATPRTAGYGIQNEVNPLENSINEPSGEHIVNVTKDPSEYEPIFSIEE